MLSPCRLASAIAVLLCVLISSQYSYMYLPNVAPYRGSWSCPRPDAARPRSWLTTLYNYPRLTEHIFPPHSPFTISGSHTSCTLHSHPCRFSRLFHELSRLPVALLPSTRPIPPFLTVQLLVPFFFGVCSNLPVPEICSRPRPLTSSRIPSRGRA
ncbi:hypothetical protein BKA62DRAFT_480226 [Auriculariales sp. MPI-PUGE-AT-0066]|nr:hypothetical protein BKA62DRAFT_480226 [Auriculariales sp. MPI-PUGE-AT-0066]